MSDKLKPCPFCGSVHLSVLDYESRYRVECNFCKARTGIWDSEADAVDEWNRRVEPAFTLDEIDTIRRMFAERYPRARTLPELEQNIIEKCKKALKGGNNEKH